MVYNRNILTDINDCYPMNSFSYGGLAEYNKEGPLKVLPDMMSDFYENSLVNIVSMSKVTEHYRVTMDSDVENEILVNVSKEPLRFKKYGDGIYYIDLNFYDNAKTNTTISSYSQGYTFLNETKPNMCSRGHIFLSTVKAKQEYYTRAKIQGADNDRDLHGHILWPSLKDYIRYINDGQLLQYNTTTDHIHICEAIYAPSNPFYRKNDTTHTTSIGKRHPSFYPITGTISTPQG